MKKRPWSSFRIRLVGYGFMLAFGLIGYRALSLQVLRHEQFETRAQRQYQRIVKLPPQRGTIYDRNGEELALSTAVDSIFVEPRHVEDVEKTARSLATALSIPYGQIKKKLVSDKSFFWIKRQVTPKESERVRELGLAGIGFTREHRRYYPNSELGSQIIGFTGLDPKGLEGLELHYDSLILGESSFLVTEKDARGKGLSYSDGMVQGGRPGHSLYLTLDKNLQYIAEKELAAGIAENRAKAGSAVVLDPRTGEILAMANQPIYNPNAFHKSRSVQRRNRAVCDIYEPGSTMKPFLVAAALNEKIVRPDQKFYCENGRYRVGGRVVHDTKKYETLTVAEILKFSSNIGSAKIGKSLGRESLYRYLTNFGFGAPTGIDFPGEGAGLLRRPEKWFEADLANISFGQGVGVTSLQLAQATAAIANGGTLMQADLVKQVVDPYGEIVEIREPRAVRRVVSPEVARQVRDMMISVTDADGTGSKSGVPGYRVAGKTGTAQKVDPVTGGYSADKRVSSFVGFVPAMDPRLVILVIVDEPDGQTYGGLVAAPVFSRIAEQSLRYLHIEPTEPDSRPSLLTEKEEVRLIAANAVREAEQLQNKEEEGQLGMMPDCIGMSGRQVLKTMERLGLNIKLKGSGRVVEQYPGALQPIRYGSEVWVELAPPT
ncbi:MAG: penicillin-binding protein [Syntrophotaleaceae bacterium]